VETLGLAGFIEAIPQGRSVDLAGLAGVRKEKQILYCELCGKRLQPEEGEPVEHGKIKICKACYIDLNWFKSKSGRECLKTEATS
jgi:transposase-like protein